ncbi:MAG: MraY family glycosyltransferase [Bryobacteraceae bacterium]|jgi:UDP-GlcNAc:undecaprenyl-phosphate GlcNAc-1-phosphate transferase
MRTIIHLLLLFALTGLLSALLTWALARFGARLGLVAAPTVDRWHKRDTPTSGGLAILLACGLVYCRALGGAFAPMAAGTLLLSMAGFIDDRLKLKAVTKLTVQICAAAWMILSGYVFHASPWPIANAAFSFLWILGITNAFNLIDNMDGLCAGVTVIIACFRIGLLVSRGYALEAGMLAVIAGGFAGFLIFNRNPAKIFMGDTGSMLAGFSLATLTIGSPLAHTKVFALELAYPVLTFVYPIFDVALVSILRSIAGRSISIGGRDHSSHRIALAGLGERRTVWILWTLTALGGFAGLLIQWEPLVLGAAAALVLLLFTVFGIFLANLPSARERAVE